MRIRRSCLIAACFLTFQCWAQTYYPILAYNSDSVFCLNFAYEPPRMQFLGLVRQFNSETHFQNRGNTKLISLGKYLYNRTFKLIDSLELDTGIFDNNSILTPLPILATSDSTVFYWLSTVTRFNQQYLCRSKIDYNLNSGNGGIDNSIRTEKITNDKITGRIYQVFYKTSNNNRDYWIVTTTKDSFLSIWLSDGVVNGLTKSYAGNQIQSNMDFTSNKLGISFLNQVIHQGKVFLCLYKIDTVDGSVNCVDTVASAVYIPNQSPFRGYSASLGYDFVYYSLSVYDSVISKNRCKLFQYSHANKKTQLIYEPDTERTANEGHAIFSAPSGLLLVSHAAYGDTSIRYSVIRYPDRPFPFCKFEFISMCSVIPLNFGSHTLNNCSPVNRDPALFHKVSFEYFGNCDSIYLINKSDTSFYKTFIWYTSADSMSDGFDSTAGHLGRFRFSQAESKRWIKLKAISPTNDIAWFSDSVYKFRGIKAGFKFGNTNCVFRPVNFIDTGLVDTTNFITGRWWHWRFGDGTDTLIRLPYHQAGNGSVGHTYTKPGKYTVSLVFGNGFCTDSITQTQQVEILDAPKPGINALTQSNCLPFTLVVDDTVTNAVKKRYEWGDGKDTASPPAPLRWRGEHTYADSGSFWVKQTLTSASGCVTKDSLLLQLFHTPKINLGNDTILCEGEVIVIPANADSVIPGLTRLRWNTGDTTTSLSISKPGLYWLQATNGLCVVWDSLLVSDAGGLCKLSFYLVPNPAQDNTELRGYARQQATLSLAAIDMAGRELFTTKPRAIEGSFAIPITTAHWAAGMYVLRLQVAGENSPRQMKLVVAP